MYPITVENFLSSNTVSFFLILGVIFLLVKSRTKKGLPPGPWGFPILGYLPFIGKEPHNTFTELAKKYGSVFSLYIGRTHTVVLGDFEVIKEAFADPALLGRSKSTFILIPGGLGFADTNGEEWQEQRRFSMRAMRNLGLGKSSWEDIVKEEVSEVLTFIKSCNGKPIDIIKLLISSTANNITSLITGKRIPRGPQREFLDHCIHSVGQTFSQAGIQFFFPELSGLLVKLGFRGYDKLHDNMLAFNQYIRKEVEEYRTSSGDENLTKDTYIEGYLEEMKLKQKENPGTTFNESNLIGNSKALLVGGTDTVTTSLTWLLMAMVIYPDVQERVLKEVESVLGERDMASWEDRLRIPYTYAAMMEVQRWKTVGPLSLARVALRDTKLRGYVIPRGTTIIPNVWDVHTNPRNWKDPEKFLPERFLRDDGSVNTKPDCYLPFSIGKRNCPGETVAMMVILAFFTGIVKHFKIESGEGRPLKEDATYGLSYEPIDRNLRFLPR